MFVRGTDLVDGFTEKQFFISLRPRPGVRKHVTLRTYLEMEGHWLPWPILILIYKVKLVYKDHPIGTNKMLSLDISGIYIEVNNMKSIPMGTCKMWSL